MCILDHKKDKSDDFSKIFITYPDLIKKNITDNVKSNNWSSDYLSRNNNVEKYIYETCKSLQIIGVSYLKYQQIKDTSDGYLTSDKGSMIGRNYELEARLSLRRALELFVEIYNFKVIKSNKENEFRLYFLVQNLKAFVVRAKNKKDYCNLSDKFSLQAISEIRKELKLFNITKPFYLKENIDLNKDGDIIHAFESFNNLFKATIPFISSLEKYIIGESYQSYAETSDIIHAHSGGITFNLKKYHVEIEALYSKIYFLSISMLKNLVEIGEKSLDNKIVELIYLFKNDLPKFLQIEKGDVVLVKNSVKARVVDILMSDYGCKKYKVEYIYKKNDWSFGFDEEWFTLKDLRKV